MYRLHRLRHTPQEHAVAMLYHIPQGHDMYAKSRNEPTRQSSCRWAWTSLYGFAGQSAACRQPKVVVRVEGRGKREAGKDCCYLYHCLICLSVTAAHSHGLPGFHVNAILTDMTDSVAPLLCLLRRVSPADSLSPLLTPFPSPCFIFYTWLLQPAHLLHSTHRIDSL